MTKTQKQELIDALTQEFKTANALLLCDYKGTSVKSLEELRALARQAGAKVQVIKNTLARIALKNSSYPDQIALSKIVVKFASANEASFSIKVGCFDGEKVDKTHILAVSKLPSREELIGMLLSVWTAPARYFVTGLDNLKKQKEQN